MIGQAFEEEHSNLNQFLEGGSRYRSFFNWHLQLISPAKENTRETAMFSGYETILTYKK